MTRVRYHGDCAPRPADAGGQLPFVTGLRIATCRDFSLGGSTFQKALRRRLAELNGVGWDTVGAIDPSHVDEPLLISPVCFLLTAMHTVSDSCRLPHACLVVSE